VEQDWSEPFARLAHYYPSLKVGDLDEAQMNAYLAQIPKIEEFHSCSFAMAISQLFSKG
jgi:hypothetical protein